MPAETPRESGNQPPTYVTKAIQAMPAWKKNVLFVFGASLAAAVIVRFVLDHIIGAHGHEGWLPVAMELGVSIMLLGVSAGFMVLEFGVWMANQAAKLVGKLKFFGRNSR